MNKYFTVALLSVCVSIFTNRASATVTANTTANGAAYLTYDRVAWATVVPYDAYTDIHANPTGVSGPSADAAGQRWMYPDLFKGTSWAGAHYPTDYLTPVPDSPVAQPTGGFAMQVNTYGTNGFATGNKITDYNSTSNPNGYIGLGGSLRIASDFNEPGGSVWWDHLALREDPADSIWKIYATTGAGAGSIFELSNVTTETINGNLQLSADYEFGNSDWYNFFQSSDSGTINQNTILGHIDLIPVSAPEPSRLVLVGLGTMFTLLRRRRFPLKIPQFKTVPKKPAACS